MTKQEIEAIKVYVEATFDFLDSKGSTALETDDCFTKLLKAEAALDNLASDK